jgi:dolichyl-phosphate beta-glucosyltransferase
MPTTAPTAPAPASLTLVLPAYNEARRIGPALDELFAYLDQPHEGLPEKVDVLLVDDGSKDETAEVVRARPEFERSAGPALRLLRVAHGGKGAAVKAGMLGATGDLVVFADADMATPPDMLPLIVAALEGSEIALGSRIQADGSDMRKSQPGYRRLLGRVFHLLAAAWVVGPVKDTQCGFKGFRRRAAHDLFARQKITSIVFDVELIYLARKRGYRMAIVPIRWSDRRGSRMRTSPGLALRVAWDLFRIPLLHGRFRSAPGAATDGRPVPKGTEEG